MRKPGLLARAILQTGAELALDAVDDPLYPCYVCGRGVPWYDGYIGNCLCVYLRLRRTGTVVH